MKRLTEISVLAKFVCRECDKRAKYDVVEHDGVTVQDNYKACDRHK